MPSRMGLAICSRKKAVCADLIPHLCIYIRMCTLYTYTNTYLPRFNPSGFFGPPKCLVATPGLTSSTRCAVCVCVCIYTHIHPRTLPPAPKIEKTHDNTCIFPSVKNDSPRQATRFLHRLVEPPNPCPPMRMNKLCIHECMCTPSSVCVADMYSDVKHACEMYAPACTGAQNTCLVHTTLPIFSIVCTRPWPPRKSSSTTFYFHQFRGHLTAILMLPCFHHGLYRMLCPQYALCFLPFFFSFLFRFSIVRNDFFPLSSNEQISSTPFVDLHQTAHDQSCVMLASSSQVAFSFSVGSPILPLAPIFSPGDLLATPTERKEGQTSLLLLQFSWQYCSAAVLLILPTLTICIQLFATLLHAKSRVSFRLVVISTCSWPSQCSCFFRKFHLLLVIVHPRPGSRHVLS